PGHPLQRGVARDDPHTGRRAGLPTRDVRRDRPALARAAHRRARGPGEHRAVPGVRRVRVHHGPRDPRRRWPAGPPPALRVPDVVGAGDHAPSAVVAGPLAGIRIVDLSTVLSGPLATALCADQGASVVKVEPPGAPDLTRQVGSRRAGLTAMYLLA